MDKKRTSELVYSANPLSYADSEVVCNMKSQCKKAACTVAWDNCTEPYQNRCGVSPILSGSHASTCSTVPYTTTSKEIATFY